MPKVLNPNASGRSYKEAVEIEAVSVDDGIKEEYRYLERKFGKRGKNWQRMIAAFDFKGGKAYDVLYLVFSKEKEPKDWKIDPKDFIWEGFYPFYFHVITPEEKYKGDVEKIRELYKPKKIRILFVGESPPPEPWDFFYLCNTQLYYAVKEAFEKGLKRKFSSDEEFLEFLKSKGVYLEDIYKRRDVWFRKTGWKFGKKKPGKKLTERRIKELLAKKYKLEKTIALTRGVAKILKKYKIKVEDIPLSFPRGYFKNSETSKDFISKLAKWIERNSRFFC